MCHASPTIVKPQRAISARGYGDTQEAPRPEARKQRRRRLDAGKMPAQLRGESSAEASPDRASMAQLAVYAGNKFWRRATCLL